MPDITPTIGQRFFAVRLALGDGVRKALSMRKFIALVKQKTGRVLHASELSAIERDQRKAVDVNDVRAVASVDPLSRGPAWLAGFPEITGRAAAASPAPTVSGTGTVADLPAPVAELDNAEEVPASPQLLAADHEKLNQKKAKAALRKPARKAAPRKTARTRRAGGER